MKYTVDKHEKYCKFKPNEEKIDSTLAPLFKSEFITLQAEGVSNIILDLAAVKYIDSSGLSALLVGNRIFSEAGGIFVICNIGEHVMKLIKISQLDKVLELLPTMEEAVDAVFMHEIQSDLGAEEQE
jgi:anti-anti-sigma factor